MTQCSALAEVFPYTAQSLLQADLPPVTSCLQPEGEDSVPELSRSMKRAILEVGETFRTTGMGTVSPQLICAVLEVEGNMGPQAWEL